MLADDLIAILAERLNANGLKLSDQRMAGLSVGEFEINFEEDDEGMWLHVYADVLSDATTLSKERLLKLLRAHNLFNDVPNATFGVSSTGALTLFMRVQLLETLLPEVWMAMFLSFLVSLRDWREVLTAEGEGEAPAAEEPVVTIEAEPFTVPDDRFNALNGLCV